MCWGQSSSSMQWFYAINGERLGPVTPEQLSTLVANGTVTSETLVWREGFANWEPWGSVAAANPLPAADPGAPIPEATVQAAVETGPEQEWSMDEFTQQLAQNGYATSVGGALSRAWATYKSFFGLALGAMLVVMLISMVAGLLPIVGFLSGILVTPHLNAGAAWLFLKRARGEEVEFGDVFAGFSRCYGKLALLGLIQFVVVIGLVVVFGILMAVLGVPLSESGPGNPPQMEPAAAMGLMVAVFFFMLVGIFLTARFLLSHIVAIDRAEGAVDAYRMSWRITSGKFWTVFGLLLVMMLLGIAGTLALLIGLLFVMPLYPALIAQLYHDACESAAGRPPE